MKVYNNSKEELAGLLELKLSQADMLTCHKMIVHPQVLVC